MAARKNDDRAQEQGPQDGTLVEMLRFLLDQKKGHLKIVTNMRSEVPDDQLVPRAGNPLADPNAYVMHDVVELEGPDDMGLMTAISAENDRVRGKPAGLVRALTKHAPLTGEG